VGAVRIHRQGKRISVQEQRIPDQRGIQGAFAVSLLLHALVAALKEFEGTLCFISHDIYFINALADSVVHIEQGKTTVYPGNYDYFSRRQAQIQEEAAGAKKKAGPAPAPRADAADWEEKKRQEAEGRKKTRRAETLKKEIAYSRKTVESLAAKMSAPEIYSDYKQVQELGDKIHALESKIAAYTEELKTLEGETAGQPGG